MTGEIRVDYDQLEDVASRFANQAQATQQLLQKVHSSMAPLEEGAWVGRGSEAFFREMYNKVLPASQRLQTVLEEASRVTRAIIQKARQAEDEACAPFRRA